jgi:UDP-D-galactose:(glucosyl)LPS alpha-1,3-D-galactosyltransferase
LSIIVFAIDDAYCLPLLVAWQSLYETNRELLPGLDVVVLHEQLGDESAGRLEFHARRLGLRTGLVAASLPDLPYNVSYGGTRANYLRLAIPDALRGQDRVLYVDADVVIRGDLNPLLGADLHGMPLGAVRDQVNPTYELGSALPGWQSLGIPGHREYFSSGVLVIDLVAAGREDVFGRALQVVAEHPEQLRLWDQDALNVAAADRWYRLPDRWNSAPFSALTRTPWIRYRAERLVPLADLIAAEDQAVITHYVSPSKPWKGLLPEGTANALYQRHVGAVLAAEDVPGPGIPPQRKDRVP